MTSVRTSTVLIWTRSCLSMFEKLMFEFVRCSKILFNPSLQIMHPIQLRSPESLGGVSALFWNKTNIRQEIKIYLFLKNNTWMATRIGILLLTQNFSTKSHWLNLHQNQTKLQNRQTIMMIAHSEAFSKVIEKYSWNWPFFIRRCCNPKKKHLVLKT